MGNSHAEALADCTLPTDPHHTQAMLRYLNKYHHLLGQVRFFCARLPRHELVSACQIGMKGLIGEMHLSEQCLYSLQLLQTHLVSLKRHLQISFRLAKRL